MASATGLPCYYVVSPSGDTLAFIDGDQYEGETREQVYERAKAALARHPRGSYIEEV